MFQVIEQDCMINNVESKLQDQKYNPRHRHDRKVPLNIRCGGDAADAVL